MKKKLLEMKEVYKFITLEGSHYDVGVQLGEKLRDNMKHYPNIITDSFKPERTGFKSLQEALDLCETYCPGMIEEVEGLADGFNVTSKKIAFAKYLVPTRSHSNNCSQLVVLPSITEDNAIYVGRSYDYHPDDEDKILLRTKIKKKYAHFGFSLQALGRAEGLNSEGLVVSMTGGGAFDAPTTNKKAFNYCIAIRALLENCRSVDKAVDMLVEMPVYSSTIYLISDNSGNAALVEGIDSKFALHFVNKDSKNQFIISTNHYNHPKLISYNKYVNPWIMSNSETRYKTIESLLLSSSPNITKDTIIRILSQEIPDGVCARFFSEWFGTLWSVFFDVKQKSIDVCFGPPTHNPYHQFNLKDPMEDMDFTAALVNKFSSD